jgi:hypothetical protein
MVLVLSDEARESRVHQSAIEILTRELRRPPDEVTRTYEMVLAGLQEQARIKAFLHIFASKRVKALMGG